MTKYVVLGLGVIGYYTVFSLLERQVPGSDITIVAEFWPGDEYVEYALPYAGANFSCITDDDDKTMFYDQYTYENLAKIQQKLGGAEASGLDRYMLTEFWDRMPSEKKKAGYRTYLQNYEELTELAPGTEYGIKFLSWNFNTVKFLKASKAYFEKQGVTMKRAKLSHVCQAFGADTKVVFNCTGLGAKHLGGVNDLACYPTRGQICIIKAPHIKDNTMRWGDDYCTYIIKRPFSNDQLVLGGFMQKDWHTMATYQDQTEDIWKRTTTLNPKILSANPHGTSFEDLEVVRVVLGLRPSRHGGVRIEKEHVENGKHVVHNYGASGYGYQAGLGMAVEGVNLALAKDSKL